MSSLSQHIRRTTRQPLFVPPDRWSRLHLACFRVVSSFSEYLLLPPAADAGVLVRPQPLPPDYHPQLREFLYDSPDEPERYIRARDRQYWCFLAGVAALHDILELSVAADNSLDGIFTTSSLPFSDAERPVQFTFGRTRMTLHPQALVHCRCAAGAVPVLAFLCDSERLAGPPLYRPRPRPKDRQLRKLNTWSDLCDFGKPVADVRPPPPYGLALLIGIGQMQYQIYSKQPSPPETYQVYLVVAPSEEGCTVHEFFSARLGARTLAAITSPTEPYTDDIAVHCFAVDICRHSEYLDMMHRILEPWAARAKHELLPKFNASPTDEASTVAKEMLAEASAAKATMAVATAVKATEDRSTMAEDTVVAVVGSTATVATTVEATVGESTEAEGSTEAVATAVKATVDETTEAEDADVAVVGSTAAEATADESTQAEDTIAKVTVAERAVEATAAPLASISLKGARMKRKDNGHPSPASHGESRKRRRTLTRPLRISTC